jgi:hypothetical protein
MISRSFALLSGRRLDIGAPDGAAYARARIRQLLPGARQSGIRFLEGGVERQDLGRPGADLTVVLSGDRSPRWARCASCGQYEHDYSVADVEHRHFFRCVPPFHVLQFGRHLVPEDYREALHDEYPDLSAEEIVETFNGYGDFPGYFEWVADRETEEGDDRSDDSDLR